MFRFFTASPMRLMKILMLASVGSANAVWVTTSDSRPLFLNNARGWGDCAGLRPFIERELSMGAPLGVQQGPPDAPQVRVSFDEFQMLDALFCQGSNAMAIQRCLVDLLVLRGAGQAQRLLSALDCLGLSATHPVVHVLACQMARDYDVGQISDPQQALDILHDFRLWFGCGFAACASMYFYLALPKGLRITFDELFADCLSVGDFFQYCADVRNKANLAAIDALIKSTGLFPCVPSLCMAHEAMQTEIAQYGLDENGHVCHERKGQEQKIFDRAMEQLVLLISSGTQALCCAPLIRYFGFFCGGRVHLSDGRLRTMLMHGVSGLSNEHSVSWTKYFLTYFSDDLVPPSEVGRHGPSVNFDVGNGMHVLDLARIFGNEDIIAALRAQGACPGGTRVDRAPESPVRQPDIVGSGWGCGCGASLRKKNSVKNSERVTGMTHLFIDAWRQAIILGV